MAKKTNPRRRPASRADVEKAKRMAIDIAVTRAWALFFLALGDTYGFGKKRMTKLWQKVEELSRDVISGDLDIDEVIKVLHDEYGIKLEDRRK